MTTGRTWALIELGPALPWHLHASGYPWTLADYGRTACGLRYRTFHEVQMADLPPSCETCRKTRLWRAIEQWEPADEAE